MDAKSFIAEIAEMTVTDMMQTNVLASITIAQGIQESGSGAHAPGNNFFGIKSNDGTGIFRWTQEFENGQWIQIQDWFKAYPDLSGCIADHSAFLHRNSRYTLAGFFICCDRLDYVGAAHALQAAGYATDPGYAQSLIKIIQEQGLEKFDQEAVSNLQAIVDLQKRVTTLEVQLTKIAMPEWFKLEFGEHAIEGVVKDLLHVPSFWEDVAVSLRLRK